MLPCNGHPSLESITTALNEAASKLAHLTTMSIYPHLPPLPRHSGRDMICSTSRRDLLSTAFLADSMQALLPEGLSALSSIVRNWTFSLFYLMSELWGSVVVSVLVSRRRHGKGEGDEF